MKKLYYDCDGNVIKHGSQVKILTIPEELIEGLPPHDIAAIMGQIGCIVKIQGFAKENGFAEIEFVDTTGCFHTIWLAPQNLILYEPA